MERKYYLAYGSNMSLEQMAYRCPDADLLGWAEIKGYELLFKGSKSGNYATIEPKAGSKVPVLVWGISERDERNLDRYEGFPTFYYKKEFKVEIKGANQKQLIPVTYGTHKAMAYIMDESRQLGAPSKEYYKILEEGYQRFNFDMNILWEALRKSTTLPEKV